MVSEGSEYFRQALNMLFSLKIRALRTFKMVRGNKKEYLILVGDNHTPVILAYFNQASWADAFYPVYGSNFGVWVQWGRRYDFEDPVHHRLFQDRENQTVLIRRDGEKIHIPAGISDFTPLLKIIDLHFAPQSQTGVARPEAFKIPELEFTLELRPDRDRSLRRQEMERLQQRDREIRERIEWLRDIEAVYKENEQYRIMFYPFGEKRRDPVFPHFFFRNHSLRQLRRMKFYHGNIGSLGQGTLVVSRNFVQLESGGPGHEIFNRFYPREGLVFQHNPHWMKAANLRVLTPVGFDLFPYLDMDDTDRQAIVKAFIDTAVWGVGQIDINGVGKKVFSASKLKEMGKKIRSRPEEYLYFILSPKPVSHGNGQKPRLEGLILHQNDFNDFDFRFQNLGIHFAVNDEERNVIHNSVENTIVANVLDSFDHSVERLHKSLDDAFSKERTCLKSKIDHFKKFIDEKETRIIKTRLTLTESIDRIKEKEEKIFSYGAYLQMSIEKFSRLMDKNKFEFGEFFRNVSSTAKSIGSGLKEIYTVRIKEIDDQIKSLEDFQKKAEKTEEAVNNLIDNWEQTSNVYKKLEDFREAFSKNVEAVQWQCIGLQENIEKMRLLEDACKGLHNIMDQLESHIVVMTTVGRKTKLSTAVGENRAVWQWLSFEHRKMGAADQRLFRAGRCSKGGR